MLTPMRYPTSSIESNEESLSKATAAKGGCFESDINAVTVVPCGPVSPRAVTTDTPADKLAMAERKFSTCCGWVSDGVRPGSIRAGAARLIGSLSPGRPVPQRVRRQHHKPGAGSARPGDRRAREAGRGHTDARAACRRHHSRANIGRGVEALVPRIR